MARLVQGSYLPGGEQCHLLAQVSSRTYCPCLHLFQIPSKDDPKQLPDPFNDLSVGGWEITEEPVGHLSVWAVSLQGKVRPVALCLEQGGLRGGHSQEWTGDKSAFIVLPEVEEGGGLPLRPPRLLSPTQVAFIRVPIIALSVNPAVLLTPWILLLPEASDLPPYSWPWPGPPMSPQSTDQCPPWAQMPSA